MWEFQFCISSLTIIGLRRIQYFMKDNIPCSSSFISHNNPNKSVIPFIPKDDKKLLFGNQIISVERHWYQIIFWRFKAVFVCEFETYNFFARYIAWQPVSCDFFVGESSFWIFLLCLLEIEFQFFVRFVCAGINIGIVQINWLKCV